MGLLDDLKYKAAETYLNNLTSGMPKSQVRSLLYNNLYPQTYDNPLERVSDALKGISTIPTTGGQKYYHEQRDAIYADYLQIPENERHKLNGYVPVTTTQDSEYTPTKASEGARYRTLDDETLHRVRGEDGQIRYTEPRPKNASYTDRFGNFKFVQEENMENIIDDLVSEMHGTPDHYYMGENTDVVKVKNKPLYFNQNKVSAILSPWFGTHTIGRGLDPDKGDYVSFYDLWDLAPVGDYGEDQSKGIGVPQEYYDRIYLDDYYDISQENRRPLNINYGGYLPEWRIIFNNRTGEQMVQNGGYTSRIKPQKKQFGGKLIERKPYIE